MNLREQIRIKYSVKYLKETKEAYETFGYPTRLYTEIINDLGLDNSYFDQVRFHVKELIKEDGK